MNDFNTKMAAEKTDVDIIDIHTEFEKIKIDEVEIESIRNFYVYVDIQGFKKPQNRFICKEFCLLQDNGYKFHTFVKSTMSFKKLPSFHKRQALWLMNNHHKIDYDFGDMDSFDLRDQMYPKMRNKIILVKGSDKIKWLKYMFRHHGEIECIDIDSLDLDTSMKQIDPYEICDYHNQVFGWTPGPCAMSTALMIQDLAHKNTHKL